MIRVNSNNGLFLSAFILGFLTSYGRTQNSITLDPVNNFIDVEIMPNEDYLIFATNLTEGDAFSILQANTFNGNVTLSYNQTLSKGYYTTGTNIGLVLYPNHTGWTDGNVAYLRNSNSEPIHVLLGLHVYDSNAPIPGACNMEQSIRMAPFLPTHSSFWILTVEYPPGSWPKNVHALKCGGSPLQYDVYHFYLPEKSSDRETLFKDIKKMSSVKSIETHGRKVVHAGHALGSIGFANYVGTGRIVAVIVRGLTSSAAYVPTVSHGCFDPSEMENCSLFNSTLGKICGACLLFIGAFFAFFGHRCFKCQIFLIGFCVGAILSLVLLFLLASQPGSPDVTLTVVGAGILGGLVLLGIWAYFGAPALPVFVGSLILGILFASIVAYTPLTDLAILRDNSTFWLAFAIIVLLAPLFLISFPVVASIAVSSLIGTYLFIFALDEYFGSNLKFIILNFMRRATLPSFRSAIIDPPYQSADVALTVVWALLALVGIAFQLRRERDLTRAPFPHTPTWPAWLSFRRLGRRNPTPTPNTETTPLLS